MKFPEHRNMLRQTACQGGVLLERGQEGREGIAKGRVVSFLGKKCPKIECGDGTRHQEYTKSQ